MAIPKEPRQLMINIMYLVLTALLALNVSAEIFNAFKVVDDGLKNANASLDASNAELPGIIQQRAQKNQSLRTYAERAQPARQYSQELTEYIDEIVSHMVDDAGDQNGEAYNDGDYDFYKGTKILKGKKNKDVTTRYLVDEGKGAELKAKIEEYQGKFMSLIDDEDKEVFRGNMALAIDDQSWRDSPNKNVKSWEEFNFRQMPLGATLPIFSKFINDAKATEAAVLNYLMGKVGGEKVVLDQFKVVSSPKKTYVINGERFETEVFLSASASQENNTGISIKVNGQNLQPDETGAAQYTQVANGVGIKKYNAVITVVNPVTGEEKEYTSEFEYEVGERSVSVSATKMNVFYMGVPNPVEVAAAGIATKELVVNMSGAGGGGMKGGREYLDLSGDKPKIVAEAWCFPVLVHELIKGAMELLAAHGLPEDERIADYVIEKADFLKGEVWDMRLGPGIWEKFIDSIEGDAYDIKHYLYYEIAQMPVDEFHEFMRELLSGSQRGKQMLVDLANDVQRDIKEREAQKALGDYDDDDDIDDIDISDIFS